MVSGSWIIYEGQMRMYIKGLGGEGRGYDV